MRKIVAFTFIMILSCTYVFAQTVDIKRRGVLNVCTFFDFKPFSMKTPGGKYIGFDMSLAQMIANDLDVKLNVIDTPWASLILNLNNNTCDMLISGLSITGERKKLVDFSDLYYANGLIMLVNNSRKKDIRSFRDINNSDIIIATRGDSSASNVIENFFPKAQKNYKIGIYEALNLVIDNHADVFIYDATYILSVYKDPLISKSTYAISVPFTYEPMGIAVKKGNRDLLIYLNNFLLKIKDNGEYQELVEYWINNNEWESSYGF